MGYILEMIVVLFPEYDLLTEHNNQTNDMEVKYPYIDCDNYVCIDEVTEIHWFEFCMFYLVDKLKLGNLSIDMLLKGKHIVNFLYKIFEEEYYDKLPN